MIFEAIHKLPLEGRGVRKTLVLVTSKSFYWAPEAEGRRCLRGMPEVSSLRACLKACKVARAGVNPSLRDKKRHTRVCKGRGVEGWACKATPQAPVLFNTGALHAPLPWGGG